MQAVNWQGMRKVSVERVPDPVIREPDDADAVVTLRACKPAASWAGWPNAGLLCGWC